MGEGWKAHVFSKSTVGMKGDSEMSDTIECSTCLYWYRKDRNEGECRAQQPVPMMVPVQGGLVGNPQVGMMSFFPTTRGDIWCGMHQRFGRKGVDES